MPDQPLPAGLPEDNRKIAEEIYNLIMATIEPELTLDQIPQLDAKYAGEAEEQKQTRMKRYEDAYKKFDEELAKFMATVQEKARESKRTAMKEQEDKDKSQDAEQMASLESSFK